MHYLIYVFNSPSSATRGRGGYSPFPSDPGSAPGSAPIHSPLLLPFLRAPQAGSLLESCLFLGVLAFLKCVYRGHRGVSLLPKVGMQGGLCLLRSL